MNDIEFRCFLGLLMCSDPWPLDDEIYNNQKILKNLANSEAAKIGYSSWFVAYHNFEV